MSNQQGEDLKPEENQEEIEEYKPLDENTLDDMDFDELKKIALERDKLASTNYGKMQHFKKKAQAPKETPKVNKDNKPSSEEDDDDIDLKKTVSELALSDKKRSFGYEHDLSPKEVDNIVKYAGADGDWEGALEDPFVKSGLEALRKSKRVEEAIPKSSGSPMARVESKSREKMTPAEKQKAFEQYLESKKK